MSKAITISDLNKMKQAGEKIACLTSYDACFAKLQEKAGVDVLLVGDSLGMVLHGQETTVSVTMSDMIYHTRLVSQNCTRPLVMSDMPFMSYGSPAQALGNASRLIAEAGAKMVKLEGGAMFADTISLLSDHGIAVCAHLGLTPQSVHKIGGYFVQGRDEESAKQLTDDALLLEKAGAECLLLECVPATVAADITAEINIPVIGIGAGLDCDAQVLVAHDMLGMSAYQPKFSRNFLQETDSIESAFRNYVTAVKSQVFPDAAHIF